jgi:hypothetical protein
MRTIIAGSRSITRKKTITEAHKASGFEITCVISGGAEGVDKLGELYATHIGVDVVVFPAQWDLYGRKAGYIRNAKMARFGEALLAIWDGKSKGTKHMIDIATKEGLKVYVHRTDQERAQASNTELGMVANGV